MQSSFFFTYDIIFLITRELPLSDRYKALCVSRAWYPPCQQALYDRVEISSRDQLKMFLASVRASEDSMYPVGNMVRSLRINDMVLLKQSEFDNLPSLLPNLMYLDIAPKVWWRIKLREHMRGWTTFQRVSVTNHPMELRRLSYLSEAQIHGLYIRPKHDTFPWTPSTVIPLLAPSLTYLQSLELGGVTNETLILQDFRVMQEKLPMLTDLQITSPVTIFIDWIDGHQMVFSAQRFERLETLTLCSTFVYNHENAAMHFASMFYNIKRLCIYDPFNRIEEAKFTAMTVAAFGKYCRQLICIELNPYYDEFLDRDIQQDWLIDMIVKNLAMSPLRAFDIPIEFVRPLLSQDIENLELSSRRADIGRWIPSLLSELHTITRVSIEWKEDTAASLTSILTCLPNVSSLTIDGYRNTHRAGSEEKIRQELSQFCGKRQHPLMELTIRNSHIHSLYLEVIRQVFTSLERLVLQKIWFFERVNEFLSEIALPDTLRSLEIDRVSSSPKHDDGPKFYSRFLGVASSSSFPEDIKARTRWFHCYSENNNDGIIASIQEICRKEDQDVIENYRLPTRGHTATDCYVCRNKANEYLGRHDWRQDLSVGRIRVICKSLETIKFNNAPLFTYN